MGEGREWQRDERERLFPLRQPRQEIGGARFHERRRARTSIKKLAATSDILVENYKVGGLAKYGLDYESLKTINPRLIYCSITGFGQTGPYKDLAGYDFQIQGLGGLMSITGLPDGVPGGGPVKVGVAVADIFTGLYATIGILAAVNRRHATGQGEWIDIALLDTQVAVLANQAMNYLVSGNSPARLGNAHPNIVPYQAFETADGHVILAVGNDDQFAKFCRIAGRDAWASDARFATNSARVANRVELCAMIAELMRARIDARMARRAGPREHPQRADQHPRASVRRPAGCGARRAAGPAARERRHRALRCVSDPDAGGGERGAGGTAGAGGAYRTWS